MSRVVVAATPEYAEALVRCGVEVLARCDPDDLAVRVSSGVGIPAGADALVVPARHVVLGPDLVAHCDARGIRIIAVAEDAVDAGRARRLGIACASASDPWSIVDALSGAGAIERSAAGATHDGPFGRIIAVWGPAGAPGRTTIATLLASELARGGRHVALVDADTHAPSLGLLLGLADEGPGFAAACRAADAETLDRAELERISQPVHVSGGRVDVLCGINRPGRWPELSGERVTAALAQCRDWADYTVVDVSSSLERDEEILSDLDGPRRSAATLATLESADLVVAVGSIDPLGIARLLRGLSDLRAHVGGAPVAVVANKLRPGALGMDARGQVRRALERLGGIDDVWFAPFDQRATDAALRDARLIAEGTPRAAIVQAMRRFVGEALMPLLGVVESDGARAAGRPASTRRRQRQRQWQRKGQWQAQWQWPRRRHGARGRSEEGEEPGERRRGALADRLDAPPVG